MERDATVQACQLHKAHSPSNQTVEWHHIVPVAWQLHTPNPTARPSWGPDTDGRGMLWDDRGVWICPTGHRNVHHWISAIMHELIGPPVLALVSAVTYGVPGKYRATQEAKEALLALTRAYACGVDFEALAAAGEWGQS